MSVHRVRFIEHQPFGINYIVSTPAKYRNVPLAAVAREDNSVEIWQLFGSSPIPAVHDFESNQSGDRISKSQSKRVMLDETCGVCRLRIPGSTDKAVTGLIWATHSFANLSPNNVAHDDSDSDADMQVDEPEQSKSKQLVAVPRLFVSHTDGSIVEFTFPSEQAHVPFIKRQVSALGGGSVSAMIVSPSQKYMVAAFEQGLVRVYDLTLYNELNGTFATFESLKTLERVPELVLSMTGFPSESDDEWQFATGGSEGTVRVWSFMSGQCQTVMRIATKDSHGELFVTCMAGLTLADGQYMLVTGDSSGAVRVWDAQAGMVLQSFNAHHLGGVSSVSASLDGTAFVTGGMDGRTSLFTIHQNSQFAVSTTRHLHTHDVKALCWHQSAANGLPVDTVQQGKRKLTSPLQQQPANGWKFDGLISGGVDTQLQVMTNPRDNFGRSVVQPARVPANSMAQFKCQVIAEKKWLLAVDGSCIQLHQLGSAYENSDQEMTSEKYEATKKMHAVAVNPRYLCSLTTLNGDQPWDVSMSLCGQYLAVCEQSGLKLFRVVVDEIDGSVTLAKASHLLPKTLSVCIKCSWKSDYELVVAGMDNSVSVMHVSESFVEITSSFEHSPRSLITQLSVSDEYIGVGDMANNVNLYTIGGALTKCQMQLQDGAVLLVQLLNVSRLKCGASDTALLVITRGEQDNDLHYHVTDVASGKAIQPLQHALNSIQWLGKRREHVTRAFISLESDAKTGPVMIMHSLRWLVRVPLKQLVRNYRKRMDAVPEDADIGTRVEAEKRLQQSIYYTHDFDTVLYYGQLSAAEQVVVERPWSIIQQQFPAPVYKRKYGGRL